MQRTGIIFTFGSNFTIVNRIPSCPGAVIRISCGVHCHPFLVTAVIGTGFLIGIQGDGYQCIFRLGLLRSFLHLTGIQRRIIHRHSVACRTGELHTNAEGGSVRRDSQKFFDLCPIFTFAQNIRRPVTHFHAGCIAEYTAHSRSSGSLQVHNDLIGIAGSYFQSRTLQQAVFAFLGKLQVLSGVVHNDFYFIGAFCIEHPIQVVVFLSCTFKAAVKLSQR